MVAHLRQVQTPFLYSIGVNSRIYDTDLIYELGTLASAPQR